mmetsp:Transcript_85078/g.259929  ORF Transcript_85078/g.259929 Transcript_85078/m.259929 type:complete len:242 (-) Transcript_85078:1308-2033(-)
MPSSTCWHAAALDHSMSNPRGCSQQGQHVSGMAAVRKLSNLRRPSWDGLGIAYTSQYGVGRPRPLSMRTMSTALISWNWSRPSMSMSSLAFACGSQLYSNVKWPLTRRLDWLKLELSGTVIRLFATMSDGGMSKKHSAWPRNSVWHLPVSGQAMPELCHTSKKTARQKYKGSAKPFDCLMIASRRAWAARSATFSWSYSSQTFSKLPPITPMGSASTQRDQIIVKQATAFPAGVVGVCSSP